MVVGGSKGRQRATRGLELPRYRPEKVPARKWRRIVPCVHRISHTEDLATDDTVAAAYAYGRCRWSVERFRSSLHGEGADLRAADFYFYAVGGTGIVSLRDGAAH